MSNRILVVLALIAWATPRVSHADGTDSDADLANKNKARALATQAVADFRLRNLEKAAAEFKESFKLYQSPSTMFNLAQTYRQLKNYEQALYAYQVYLSIAPPDAADRQVVKERIADLRNIIEQQRKATAAPPDDAVAPAATGPSHAPPLQASTQTTTAAPAAALTATAQPARREMPVYKKWWLWTIVGVVAVGVGVGVGVGVTQSKGTANNLPAVTF